MFLKKFCALTVFILIDFLIQSFIGQYILYFKGLPRSVFLKYKIMYFYSWRFLILPNSAGPDEMPP